MKTSSTVLGVLLAASFSLPSLRAEEPLKLKPTWEVGKVYRQTQVIDMTTAIPGVGDQKTDMTMETSMAVTKDGEDKVVTMTIDSIVMKITMGETAMAFSSKDEEGAAGNPLAAMGEMIGGEFVLVYDGADNFKDVRSIPKFAGLGAANPFGNKEAVKNLVGESMRAAFPDEAIPVGKAWKHELDMDMAKMGKVKVAMDFNYEANEERDGVTQAKVKFAGVFAGTVENEAAPGVEVKFGEGSRQDGVMYFDAARGAVTFMEASAILNMEMAGGKIPVKQKITQTLTAIDDIEK